MFNYAVSFVRPPFILTDINDILHKINNSFTKLCNSDVQDGYVTFFLR